jgi:hypothetical protein
MAKVELSKEDTSRNLKMTEKHNNPEILQPAL